MPTPPLPTWLRRFRHPSYTNIYELCPDESRVFGTESLFGDGWDAKLLLLAKDFAPRSIIEKRLADGEQRPFRPGGQKHGDGMGKQTNDNLQHLAKELGSIPLLYGSVFGGLLRNDGKPSGPLPDYSRVAREYAEPLLLWCVTQLPKLRGIACLGNEARDVVARCAGVNMATRGEPFPITIGRRRLTAFWLYHPSRAQQGGFPARLKEWRNMGQVLGGGTPL